MNDEHLPADDFAHELEGRRSHELVRDEDVLSLDAQYALESVGTAVGFIAAIALLCSQLPRAIRLLGQTAGAPKASGGKP